MESRTITLGGSPTRKDSDIDQQMPRSFTLEQTIDLLERRQEAAVLRHLREVNSDSLWAGDMDQAIGDCRPARSQPSGEFRHLSKAQIAEVMAGEQKLLESRIRRSVSRRRSSLSSGL